MDRRGQAWYVDLFFGILIFVLSFSILMKSDVNLKTPEEDLQREMKIDGDRISSMLLSPGVPKDWNESNVISPGIIEQGKIDDSKLSSMINMTYPEVRSKLRSRFNFMFMLLNQTHVVPFQGLDYYGKPGVSPGNISTAESPDQILKVSRLAVYGSEIVRLEVFVWD